MNGSSGKGIDRFMVGGDFFLLNLALYLGFVLGESAWLPGEEFEYELYALNVLLLNFYWYYVGHLLALYKDGAQREAEEILQWALAALALWAAGYLAFQLTFDEDSLPPLVFAWAFSLFSLSLVTLKIVFLFIRKYWARVWVNERKAVIVGAGPAALTLYDYLTAHPQLGYGVKGFFADASPAQGHPAPLGRVKDCIAYVRTNGVEEIFCALPAAELRRTRVLLRRANRHKIRFRLVPDTKDLFDKHAIVELNGRLSILASRQEPLAEKANEIIKRLFDVVFSGLVVVLVLSWLGPIIALLIKLESKGPVFFRQLRSGKDNKPFYCLKFRSMTVNADADLLQATRGDGRITRLGAFMRRTSIDELPQFFNVLKGDMSVVGPRPHMLKHTEDYSALIDQYMVRHFLTPGISGWAQVNGFRGETKDTESMENRVKADLWYMENWSLLLDLKIVFLTVWQAIKGNDKAY